jgi:hypothetical protein
MQSNPTSQQATVVLKDGNIRLAQWTHAFEQRPAIGESIAIPEHTLADLSGYDPTATITRIKMRGDEPQQIVVESHCALKPEERPVIVLNADRIRKSLRGTAEQEVRAKLRFPLITWESSALADPVIRYHDPVTGQKSCPSDLRACLLNVIHQAAVI